MADLLRFEVFPTFWAVDEQRFVAGEHEVEADEELARNIASAASAGVLRIIEGKPDASHIEPEEKSAENDRIAREAAAALYEKRDAELASTPKEEQAAVLERYRQEMNAAAQAALEEA